MRLVSRLLLSSSLLASSACYHEGEFGYLEFELDPIVDPLTEFESGDQILVGSVICPAIVTAQSQWIHQREQFRACFAETLTGPSQLDAEGCLHFEGPGEINEKAIWELTPDTCGERAERIRFALVGGDANTELEFDEWRLRALALTQDPKLGLEPEGLAPGRSLEDLIEPPHAARRVFADQIDLPLMRLRNVKGVVYWTAPELEFELLGEGIEALAPDIAKGERLDPGELALRLAPGASGWIRATLPSGAALDSPALVAVTIDDAASLDLLRVDGFLFADVRDAEGRLLHAAPIEWSVVEGAVGIIPGDLSNRVRTREYATIETRCQPPPEHGTEQRQATVRARLGELEDTVVVKWRATSRSNQPVEREASPHGGRRPSTGGFHGREDNPADEWAPADSSCMSGAMPDPASEGCGCSSTPMTPMTPMTPVLASLALLALIWRQRG